MRSELHLTGANARRARHSRMLIALLLAVIPLIGLLLSWSPGAASLLAEVMLRSTPQPLGGQGQSSDGRNDIDLYPNAAFDARTQRYLVVWMSTRRADSGSDGFDVMGKFLDAQGAPLGDEFLISDQNNAARSGGAEVVAGPNGFLTVWARGAGTCQLSYQMVTDDTNPPDALLVAAPTHVHSPSLVYNAQRKHYVLAYIEGDDYLPPKLFGASTGTCGDNAASSSTVRALEFHLVSGGVQMDGEQALTALPAGAFRPRLAFNAGLKQYLVAWEDRRNAGGQPYRFDLYAQLLNADLSLAGGNMVLQSGSDYTNLDASATWTPRPAVAADNTKFLVAWYDRQVFDAIPTWTLRGRFVAANAGLSAAFPIGEMTFAEAHPDNAPTGFVALLYNQAAQEYLAAMTSQLESVFGYFSTVRLQRIDRAGRLLRLDGGGMATVGVGAALDYDYDSQISASLAAMTNSYRGATLVVYGKHAPNQHSQDFDAWSVQTWLDVPEPPTPTPTNTPTPTSTAQAPGAANKLHLPFIKR